MPLSGRWHLLGPLLLHLPAAGWTSPRQQQPAQLSTIHTHTLRHTRTASAKPLQPGVLMPWPFLGECSVSAHEPMLDSRRRQGQRHCNSEAVGATAVLTLAAAHIFFASFRLAEWLGRELCTSGGAHRHDKWKSSGSSSCCEQGWSVWWGSAAGKACRCCCQAGRQRSLPSCTRSRHEPAAGKSCIALC